MISSNTTNYWSNPVLVTGSHRSGSTWVGHMLACAEHAGYLHEPFNTRRRKGLFNAPTRPLFAYVCDENEADYVSAVQNSLRFNYQFAAEAQTVRSLFDVGRMCRDAFVFTQKRMLRKRPIMKDPIAIFSADWLVRRFNMQAIVLIRHPAAFAGSLKKANWDFKFDNLLRQPLLMRDYFADYRTAIESHVEHPKDIIEQGILLWNLIHAVIAKYQSLAAHDSRWMFVRHEDLSRAPVEEFRAIYKHAGLQFSNKVEAHILQHSSAKPTSEDKLKRDSRSNVLSWKKRLSDEEISRIREGTADVAQLFYTHEDWGD